MHDVMDKKIDEIMKKMATAENQVEIIKAVNELRKHGKILILKGGTMDNFRDSYFQVDWDLTTKRLRGTYWGKQYDTGRGFAVTVINGGQVVTPTNEGSSGSSGRNPTTQLDMSMRLSSTAQIHR